MFRGQSGLESEDEVFSRYTVVNSLLFWTAVALKYSYLSPQKQMNKPQISL